MLRRILFALCALTIFAAPAAAQVITTPAPAKFLCLSSTLAPASAISLTSATAADVTTLSLPAGNWDVTAVGGAQAAGTTAVSQILAWISTTSATVPTPDVSNGFVQENWGGASGVAYGSTVNYAIATGTVRMSLTVTTTVYLSVRSTFFTSTMKGFGYIQACPH